MNAIEILVVAAYASLGLENLFVRVPSVASTYQLLEGSDATDSALAPEKRRSLASKILRFVLPTAIGIVLFVLPLILVFWPALLSWLWPIATLRGDVASTSGGALLVFGRALTLASVLPLRSATNTGRLNVRGLYSWTRNPALLGLHVFYLGNCLIFPCVVLLAGFVPWAVNMHVRVRLEEKHLLAELGAPYQSYLERVPRYVWF